MIAVLWRPFGRELARMERTVEESASSAPRHRAGPRMFTVVSSPKAPCVIVGMPLRVHACGQDRTVRQPPHPRNEERLS